MNNEDLIKNYEESILNKKRLEFSFWNKESLKAILRYVILDKNNYTKEDIYKNVNANFFKMNKINLRVFSSILEALQYSFDELSLIPWKFKAVPKGYWNSLENRIEALKWLINTLIENGEIDNLDEVPSKLRQNHFRQYNLLGLDRKMFLENESAFDLLSIIYPEKWIFRDFTYLKKGYANFSESEMTQFVRDFVLSQGINSREKLLQITAKLFRDNNLGGLINKFYSNSTSTCIIQSFPECRFMEWEFTKAKNGYWQNKITRCQALKELIEVELELSLDEIPSVISYSFLQDNYYKFRVVLDKYYNSNIFRWIDEVYPSKFNEKDFFEKICLDGTKVLSKQEMQIHNFLIENSTKDVNYIGNNRTFIFHNDKYNENYMPDWIVNDNIIIEYFGLYHPKRWNNSIISSYVDKTKRKMEFFNRYCNENKQNTFIAIFPDDLKNSMKTFKEKLSIVL